MASGGLKPVYNLASTTNGGQLSPLNYKIQPGYATSLFLGDPVMVGANGFLVRATDNSTCVGVFQGVKYHYLNPVPGAGAIAQDKYYPASLQTKPNTTIDPLVVDDPNAIFAIRANATFSRANLYKNYAFDFSAPGDPATGQSGATLNVSAGGSDLVTLPLKAIGILNQIGNDFGIPSPFTIVLCKLNAHAYSAGTTGIV